jgi:methionyl-tRNA formyltransferase
VSRIIFAGTPEIAAGVLQTLIDAKYNVIACLTQPDRPQGRGLKLHPSAVKTIALQNNIPVLQPKTLKSTEVQEQLKDLQADLMIVLAYGLILPSAVLNIPRLGCVNIHASLLPRWRGAAPIQHAILAGDPETGITIMQMDAGLDTGAMLAKYRCVINPNDTSDDLHDRLAKLAQSSIIDVLPKILNGTIVAEPQDDKLATYANKIDKQDAKINWSDSASIIERKIRSYNSWPVAFTSFKEETVRIWQALNTDVSSDLQPGTIINVNPKFIEVATGVGTIQIITMQFPGKKPLPIAEILNSNKELVAGQVFK